MVWPPRFRRLLTEPPDSVWSWLLWRLLWPCGFLYGCLGWLRIRCYRCGLMSVYRSCVPVVSVGNLSVGGTGKTPMVDHVARHYLLRGLRVAIVSRGYGRSGEAPLAVVCSGNGPQLSAADCGDEPYLLAARNPQALVIVAPRRRDGVKAAEQMGAEVVILDDGFQHLGVARDLDIVLLDARRPLGNGHVLPAGMLREFPSALARGHLFVLTRSQGECPLPFNLPGPVLTSRHVLADCVTSLDGQSLPLSTLSALSGKQGLAFAGIANPEFFFNDLTAAGLLVSKSFAFPDHAGYGKERLAALRLAALEVDFLITTEKDGAKLAPGMFDRPCYQVPLVLQFEDQAPLTVALNNLVEKQT